MSSTQHEQSLKATTPLNIAIIGAGLAGLTLGIGLHARGIPFTIFERAPQLPNVGAGFGLSPNAERAMKLLGGGVHAAFKRAATPNGEDYFQWIDGYRTGELLHKLYVGKDGFEGCRRVDFLEELVQILPVGTLKFGKRAESIERRGDGMVVVSFADGTREVADAVIGCDGIHSRIRHLLFGSAARASYSNTYCFRTLVPRAIAETAIGKYAASTRFMYNGPGAHAITYPVGKHGEQLNVLLVIHEKDGGSAVSDTNLPSTTPGRRVDAEAAFAGWHPTARALAGLLPDETERWNIGDMLDHPAESYAQGSVCIAGDAAHAAGPHLGAGAGFGIEDALALATALGEVVRVLSAERGDARPHRSGLVHAALQAYSQVRLPRTQWLVRHTRDAVDLFQWRAEGSETAEVFGREITWRFHEIWDYDLEGMQREVRGCFTEWVGADESSGSRALNVGAGLG